MAGYKETPIGRIPEDWEVVRLGDVVEVHDSKRIPLNEQQRAKMKGKYPYCGANGILDYINDYIFDGEYILLAEDGGYWGKFEQSAYIMHGKFWVNNHAHVLKALDGIADNWFLMYVLNFLDLTPYIVGSTRGKLNQKDMKNIKIPLPPLPEQKKIAEILSTVDKAIEKVDEAIAKTERLKKGLMQELLTKGIGHTEFKDTEIGRIPKEWEVVRLGDVCNQRNEVVKPSSNGKYKFVGLEHVDSGETRLHKYELDVGIKSSKFRFYAGDILYGKLRPYLDKAVLVDFDGICSTDLLVLTPKDEKKVLAEFLIYVIHSHNFIQYAIATTSGTNHPRTSWKAISKFTFGLPPFTEQQKIAEILSTVDKKLELERKRKEKLERIKKGLMNDLLTGKRRVRV